MNKAGRIGFIFWIAIALIPIAGVAWSVLDPTKFQNIQDALRQIIVPLGLFGPLVFILVQAAQVVFAPISHYAVGAVGGYLYGPVWGGVINWIGRLIGHTAAFFIARKAGRPILEKYVQASVLKRYDRIFGDIPGTKTSFQPLILFLVYFLPLLPDDEASYLVGASKMPFRHFLFANLFGQLGGSFSLAYIGSGVDTRDICQRKNSQPSWPKRLAKRKIA